MMQRKLEALSLVTFLLSCAFVFVSCQDDPPTLANWRSTKKLGKEKVTHLHFYFQEITIGDDPTAVIVAEAPATKNSTTIFGTLFVADDLLTVGPDLASRSIGKAQGIYAADSKEELSLLFAVYLIFTEGKYNGSSISLFGMNRISHIHREIPVVGGTGVFRLARGFALTKLLSNLTSGHALVEYWLTVMHY